MVKQPVPQKSNSGRRFVRKPPPNVQEKQLDQTPVPPNTVSVGVQPIGSRKRGGTGEDDGVQAKNQKTNNEEVDAKTRRLNQLEFENARLKSEMVTLKQDVKKSEGLMKEVEELRKENQRLHVKIEAYEKKEAESSSPKEEILDSDDEDEEEACRELEKKRILQNKNMFASYRIELNEINKWKARCAELEEVIAVMTDAMETNGVAGQEELREDYRALMARNDEMGRQIKALEEELKEKDEIIAEMTTVEQAMTSRVSNLENAKEAVQKEKLKNRGVEADATKDIKAEIIRKDSRILELEGQIRQLEITIQDLRSSSSAELEEKDREIADLMKVRDNLAVIVQCHKRLIANGMAHLIR